MTREDREIRRAAGAIAVSVGRARLDRVSDGRARRGRRWKASALWRAMLVGMLAGKRSLKETEGLTERLSGPMRRKLGISRRVPDTTMREMAVATPWESVRDVLHGQARAARRKKQLEPVGLPCGVLAIDGKTTMTNMDDGEFAQEQGPGRFAVRTMTCALVSGSATVTVHVSPVPRERNEMSHFVPTLREITDAWGRGELFGLVTTDAGMTSKANADFVHDELHTGYLFALKDNQPDLRSEADRLLARLGADAVAAETRERIGGRVHRRRVWLTDEIAGFHDWTHLRTVMRVEYEVTAKDGTLVSTMNRYFITNERARRFTPEQWLHIVRAHWRVENDVHKTLDVELGEDERPWIRAVPGMLVIQVLRRIACNALVLLRSRTLRRRQARAASTPPLVEWGTLFARLHKALIAAQDRHVEGLRWAQETTTTPC